ncbi:RagB/SusD family nutrient uptake outer membrane protein [Filimonas effusa]|uniref:RagB/SusD family nutrient uptake outer membrane protein n=1 Tax=Filimonas effusa TaxID=2508721 RepID=A0A4Q1DCT1_9BACT|nr:RagB/SusD family nutrient uptake outer membrane protein [Filimonas effusa]RXK86778.1 RagB/SusD family nutrient uptake outer membrane protein [Filimonas effusa]
MNKIYSCLLLLGLLSLSSCSKFLEEYSRDQRYVQTPEDLDKLMIGEAFINPLSLTISSQATMSTLASDDGITLPWLHVMDDDCEQFAVNFTETEKLTSLYMLGNFHNWMQAPNVDVLKKTWVDVAWRKIYKRIGALNSIIFQAEEMVKNGNKSSILNRVIGEGYFLRAYYYFNLQNVYGSPYRKQTAASDEGVPVKVSEKVEDKYFSRSSNEVVYNQIIADLDKAAEAFNDYNPGTRVRVGIAAVKALQSRVYLYTEQYDKVLDAAKDIETLGYDFLDLNQYVANTSFTKRSSPETIFTMGSNEMPAVFANDSLSAYNGDDNRASCFKASGDLLNQFATNDLRRTAFFRRSTKNQAWLPAKYRTWTTYNDPEQVSCLFYIRYAEVVLNRAEALAMLGSDDLARTELQKLRSKRFANASIADLPQSNQALVDFIRAERRRELCFEGHRWFDLRRYGVNSKYPLADNFTIRHPNYTYDASSKTYVPSGAFELKSIKMDAAAWQAPIPDYAIEFNQGALTNPVRPVRNVVP